MNILIVEDDAERIQQFRQNLPGHNITVTDDPDEAVALLTVRDFKVVFLDYDMDLSRQPERKGAEIIPRIERCRDCIRAIRWFIHSLNPAGADYMAARLARAGARVSRYPFAWQDPALDLRINSGRMVPHHAVPA